MFATNNLSRIKPPVGAQINWGHPLAKGLIGCWLINEGRGNYINNIVNKPKAKGTLGSTAPNWKNGGLEFTGSQWIDLGNTNLVVGLKAVSSACLFNCTDMSLGTCDIVRHDGTYTPFQLVPGSNQCLWGVWPDGPGNRFTTTFTQNQWVMAVCAWATTYNVGDPVMYHNGVQLAQVSTVRQQVNSIASSGNAMTIGSTEGHNAEFFKGNVKLVYYWNRVLSQAEASLLYKSPYCFFKTSPIPRVNTAGAAATANFRKTLSGAGTSIGKRQLTGWGQ